MDGFVCCKQGHQYTLTYGKVMKPRNLELCEACMARQVSLHTILAFLLEQVGITKSNACCSMLCPAGLEPCKQVI